MGSVRRAAMNDIMNANYSHIPSPNNIYADGVAIGRPDPARDQSRVFDPSPNGTSLPLTYAPRPCKKAQFSESGFDKQPGHEDEESHMEYSSLATPAVTQSKVEASESRHYVPNATPPQGWHGGYDSSLSKHRLTASSCTMVDPSAQRGRPAYGVAELLAPSLGEVEPPTQNLSRGLQDQVTIQDWQSNCDSQLCARRQFRGQGL